VIQGRGKDLGGFSVRRVLPVAKRRMVGPFIFFDHMGPAEFAPGKGVDVRPHPHINLSTLTWLFEGGLHHRDNLGSDVVIRPGAVNWMTAGRGIVHSERTEDGDRANGHRLHGIQCWVAMPEADEETNPEFFHHGADALPRLTADNVEMTLIVGSAYGETSPVKAYSPIFYLQADIAPYGRFKMPEEYSERAVYVVSGEIEIDGDTLVEGDMGVFNTGASPEISASVDSRLMLLGGEPLGERTIWWNYVSSDPDRIESAKDAWSEAAAAGFPQDGVFTLPPGETEHIPLPER